MKICEYCSKEHDGSYGSGRFCCDKCARGFSTKNEKDFKKEAFCKKCNSKIIINKRASIKNVLCEKCKKLNEIRICKICGQIKPCRRPDICRKHKLFPNLIKYFGLKEEYIGTIKIYEEYDKIKNLVYEDYYDNKLNIIKMAEKYNHNNHGNFYKILNSLELEFRSNSESQQISLLNNINQHKYINNYRFKCGWHTTWNNKKVFYRSSYELDYAKKLDTQEIDYEMEKIRILYWDSIQQKQRVAIPDFYLIEENKIVEIKSIYTFDKQNLKDKIKAYKECGYKFELILDKKIIDIESL